jgi:hypothetical protein
MQRTSTFAGLLQEIRRRARMEPPDLPRAVALERAARVVLGPDEPDPAYRILRAIVGAGPEYTFDLAALESLTPDLVLRLDQVAAEIVARGLKVDVARAVRSSDIKHVH